MEARIAKFRLPPVLLVGAFHTILTALAVYVLWGWITLNDFKAYCVAHSLDYHLTLSQLVQDWDTNITASKDGFTWQDRPREVFAPLFRFTVPFSFTSASKDGMQVAAGAMLEPFMVMTENTSNAVFSAGIGFLFGIMIITSEMLSNKTLGVRRAFLRPIHASGGALLSYVVVLAGGSIIWNQASGVSGLSIGVIAAFGALYSEQIGKIKVRNSVPAK